ncbi:MAG: hypothetical protein ABR607_00585 [Pyrinomonadaceae bacterium]
MPPTIHLAFVDDWELSGDGSGDPRDLQFQPMRELVRIFNAHGVRGSFNAEVMQQLTFRRVGRGNREVNALADDWEQNVLGTFQAGHDIQLHIHPQWNDARYENGRWQLHGDWSILKYSADEARLMIGQGKEYLESLLRTVDPNYRCVSFRSGSWCIAPSSHILNTLVDFGIVFDMSIVGGVRYHTRRIDLNYTNCEEDFLPFYPVMTDARKVSNKREPIVCVPTNHFYGSRRQTIQHHARKVIGSVKRRVTSPGNESGSGRTVATYGHEWAQADATPFKKVYEKGVLPYLKGRHLISDLAQLDYPLMTEMLASIRKRARAANVDAVPIILENHTKDIHNFSHIERFIEHVSQAPDIKCMTLSEIAADIRRSRFPIKTAGAK